MGNLDIVKNAVADQVRDLMRSKTIDKISVTEICEKTGLNRRNFYRYFQDKYEVVDWIYFHDVLVNTERFDGWSFWDYWPKIAHDLYNDPDFYRNAFSYRGQNSFRDYCIKHLTALLDPDYKKAFPSEEAEKFYFEHICNDSFDAFVIWLSGKPPMPVDQFVQYFESIMESTSRLHIELIERATPKPENPQIYTTPEPSKK